MNPATLHAVYFSPTNATRTIVTTMAQCLAAQYALPVNAFDITLPDLRQTPLLFSPGSLVLVGVPVYAGRVPNLLAPYLSTLRGNGALAVPIVLFGNRAFDDALMELRTLLDAGGFQTVAAGAFIGEHSFSHALGGGQPDEVDQSLAVNFANRIAQKLRNYDAPEKLPPVTVPGNNPVGPYFRPLGHDGQPIDIRKVKPLTRETCTGCTWCAQHCPMGSISHERAEEIPGICIKCNACVKGCPTESKFFADPDYLFHRDDLVYRYQSLRQEPSFFL